MPKEFNKNGNFSLLTGTGHPALAEKVGQELGKPIHHCVTKHPDNTPKIDIPENIRKKDVYIIQSTCPPNVDNHFMELIFMLNAARRASAGEITVIIPYYGYARADKMDEDRGTIAASDAAKTLEFNGADRLVSIDLHAKQTVGSVKIPWSDVYASYVLLDEIKSLNIAPEKMVIAATDEGGIKRAKKYSELLGLGSDVPNAVKTRNKITGKSTTESINGDVKGKYVIYIDDTFSSGGTMIDAAETAMKEGALNVDGFASHALFVDSGKTRAIDRLKDSAITRLYTTDSLPQRDEVLACNKVRVVSVAPLIARAIECMQSGESLIKKLYPDPSKERVFSITW